ncbi:transposase [Tolypothrix sp. VBCCA 56010]|uniref:transposase n=1 Tax=Tolypothrix sp. VBCCA 56010 TaxID=3137731 RepID=UPI003D7CED51
MQQLWSKWESQGLYIFFLPKYCSEINLIELEWQHLKKDELSGQMFDDELDASFMPSLTEFKLEERRGTTAQNVLNFTQIKLVKIPLHTYDFFHRLT